MKKLRIYLDSSVISYLDQQDSPERMAETHKFWNKIKNGDFDIAEINKCGTIKRKKLSDYLNEIKYDLIESDARSIEIASRFIELNILNKTSFLDCQHIANAIVSGCDIIVSWNFKHIVNHKTIMGTKAISALEGYNDLLIYAPNALIGGQ